MLKIKTILIALLIVIPAGYAVYVNIQLKNTVNQYEAAAVKMTKKFESVNENMLKAREELAKQRALGEDVRVSREAFRVQMVKVAEEEKKEAAKPVYKKEAKPVKMSKQEQMESEAKKKADKAKAEAEALLGQISTEPNAWEEREPHL